MWILSLSTKVTQPHACHPSSVYGVDHLELRAICAMCHTSYVIYMCVIGVRFRFPARLSIGRGSKSCTNTNTRQGIGDAVTARNLYFWNSWKQMSQSQPSIKRSSKVLCATTQKIDLCRIHHQECVIWATFPPMDALWSVAKVSKVFSRTKFAKQWQV